MCLIEVDRSLHDLTIVDQGTDPILNVAAEDLRSGLVVGGEIEVAVD